MAALIQSSRSRLYIFTNEPTESLNINDLPLEALSEIHIIKDIDVLRISSHSFRCPVLIIISGDHRIDHSYFLQCLHEIEAGNAGADVGNFIYHQRHYDSPGRRLFIPMDHALWLLPAERGI